MTHSVTQAWLYVKYGNSLLPLSDVPQRPRTHFAPLSSAEAEEERAQVRSASKLWTCEPCTPVTNPIHAEHTRPKLPLLQYTLPRPRPVGHYSFTTCQLKPTIVPTEPVSTSCPLLPLMIRDLLI